MNFIVPIYIYKFIVPQNGDFLSHVHVSIIMYNYVQIFKCIFEFQVHNQSQILVCQRHQVIQCYLHFLICIEYSLYVRTYVGNLAMCVRK